jgi:hypothetical protein
MDGIGQSSGQGALFELVARGNKDKYFIKDSNTSYFPYNPHYNSSTHHLAERRTLVPINNTTFGNTFEVEIDPYGDIMTECAFEIDLPTWLPQLPLFAPDSLPENTPNQLCTPDIINRLYPITSTINSYSYGYVNFVAYFLFEKIQFYQDQFLIQEWSGDGLLAKQLSEGSWNSSYLQQLLGGGIDSGNTTITETRGIQLRATPGHLRIKLPLPGMQCPDDIGFPLVSMPRQKFRIKATLRRIEDLVVTSDPILSKPHIEPWNVNSFTVNYDDGAIYTFQPKSLQNIGQPTILLSTIQHYLPPKLQQEFRSNIIQIPFRRQFENNFTFGELDYVTLDVGGTAAVTRRLDGRHPTERIFWFFRNYNSLDRNRLDNFYNDFFDFNLGNPTTQPFTIPYGSYYYSMKLVIAGRDRENSHEPLVWKDISQLVKDEKPSGLNIGTMKWSTGEKYGTIYPAPRQPEGTVNFSTADRPTLHIELANIRPNPLTGQRRSEFRVFTEGWAVYDIREGRGRLLFAN